MGGYVRTLSGTRYVYFSRRKDGKIENICCGKLGEPKTEARLLGLHNEQEEDAVVRTKARSAKSLEKLRRLIAETEQ